MDENEQSKSKSARQATPSNETDAASKIEPKTLMIVVGFVVALVLLVALNMK
jgi:hypothetical protein